jgi:hypothetical protein
LESQHREQVTIPPIKATTNKSKIMMMIIINDKFINLREYNQSNTVINAFWFTGSADKRGS